MTTAKPLLGIVMGSSSDWDVMSLAGVVAAQTALPVLGVPTPSKHLNGMDSLLSTVQMPKGVPVATFAIGEAGRRRQCGPVCDRHARG